MNSLFEQVHLTNFFPPLRPVGRLKMLTFLEGVDVGNVKVCLPL